MISARRPLSSDVLSRESRALNTFEKSTADDVPVRATNAAPFPFEWMDYRETFRDYGAILTRTSREYEKRF